MTRWNPGNPNIAGDEWRGSAAALQQIGSFVGRGPTFTARATQSIDTLAALIRKVSGTAQANLVVDVYDLADPVGPDTQSWVMALPVVNASISGGWVQSVAGVVSAIDATAWQKVDDVIATSTSLATGSTDQLRYTALGVAGAARFEAGNTFYDGDTGATGASITGKRISSVEVVAVMENFSANSVVTEGQLSIGGTVYNADSGPETVSYLNPALRRYRFKFYSNPATGLPWTNADAVALTNGTDVFGLAVTVKSGAGDFVVTALMLQFRVLTERRVATGSSTSAAPDEWCGFSLMDPADNTPQAWAKVSGREYLILYSLAKSSGPAGLSMIDTSTVADDPAQPLTDAGVEGWTLDNGAVPYFRAQVGEGQIPTLMYVGAAVSADSLPYGAIEVGVAGSAGAVLTQGVSTHSSQAYGTALLLVGRGAGGQDAGLVVRVKRTSDNAVLLGPTTVAAAEIPADGKYHVVSVRFTPAALSSAAPVYIEVQSTSSVAYLLPALATRTPTIAAADATSVAAAAAGIGGTADKGDATTTRDYPWAVVIAPAAPGGLTATTPTIANQPALAGGGVGVINPQPATIEYAHLAWTATALGANFGHYEIERNGVTVEIITAEASNYWNDVEGQRGTLADPVTRAYQIRVVRSDGGLSAWAAFPSVSLEVEDCADVVVSSNADPAASLAFRDLTNPHTWPQRQTARGKMEDILGRDLPVAFWLARAGGETFTRRLAVAFNDPAVGATVTPDRAVFDPALALLQNRTLPYVAYADSWGRVWLTSPAVQDPGPSREEPAGRYTITVLFTQVESTPAAFSEAVPWSP